MALTIKIGRQNQTAIVRLEMDMRKSMSGDLMVFDHGDIDIVLSPTQNKIIAFPNALYFSARHHSAAGPGPLGK